MNLGTWVDQQVKATGQTKRAVVEALASRAGVAFVTLEPVTRGARMGFYRKAKAVAEATGWEVSVLDLCDETPEDTARRIAQCFSGSCKCVRRGAGKLACAAATNPKWDPEYDSECFCTCHV